MADVQRARTVEEYARLVDEALFEIDDLRACLEWDFDEDAQQIARSVPYLGPLEEQVHALRRSMVDGSYAFATGELPFMAILREYPDRLPFADLLKRINATHCDGLDIETE